MSLRSCVTYIHTIMKGLGLFLRVHSFKNYDGLIQKIGCLIQDGSLLTVHSKLLTVHSKIIDGFIQKIAAT